MSLIYILFFIIWAVLFVVIYIQMKTSPEKFEYEPDFPKPFFKKIYQLSFAVPFIWFVDDDQNLSDKGKKLQKLLKTAEYDKYFTVRSYMAFKTMVLMVCLLLAGITIYYNYESPIISAMMVNPVDTLHNMPEPNALNVRSIIYIFSLYLALALLPDQFMKRRVKRAIVNHNKDFPTIYMFVILMLRSNKTVSEILFALTKLNTYHREVFEKGYRMFLRDKSEGIDYLKETFNNDRMTEMFNLLEDIAEYAREQCISIMESNMKSLISEINTIKRRNDLSQLVYSQASMIVPMVALILLGVAPVIVLAIKTFANSMSGGIFG